MRFSRRALTKILDMCATFLLDVAVLTFVFPILDTIVQYGKQNLTRGLIVGAFGISGVFLVLALATATVLAEIEER